MGEKVGAGSSLKTNLSSGAVGLETSAGPVKLARVGDASESQISRDMHLHSDVDSGNDSQHHTLGYGVGQAAPGPALRRVLELLDLGFEPEGPLALGMTTLSTNMGVTGSYVGTPATWANETDSSYQMPASLRIDNLVAVGTKLRVDYNCQLTWNNSSTAVVAYMGLEILKNGAVIRHPQLIIWNNKANGESRQFYRSWFIDLEPGAVYDVRVRAFNSTASGSFSVVVNQNSLVYQEL